MPSACWWASIPTGPSRWQGFDAVAAEIRAWLAQLPPEVAEQLASGNANRLFGDAEPADRADGLGWLPSS